MQRSSLESVFSSRRRVAMDVTAARKQFLCGKVWTLKDQCSLRGVANDQTAVSRRKNAEVADIVATESCIFTLSSHGTCVYRSTNDLSHSVAISPSHEQVQYILALDDYLYMISMTGKSTSLVFSRLRLAEAADNFREEILRDCRVTGNQILGVEKQTAEVAVRWDDRVELWGLREGRIKQCVAVPSTATHVCYDSGAVCFAELTGSDVIIHVVPAAGVPSRLTLRNAQQLQFLDLLSDFVLFQVANSSLQAVNFASGVRVECPKSTSKVITCRGAEPFLLDQNGILMKLADPEVRALLDSSDVDLQWAESLDAFLVFTSEKATVDVVSAEDGRLLSSLPTRRGDGVTYCSFNEETFELLVVTQRGMLEVWH